jgi:hypothetical protein
MAERFVFGFVVSVDRLWELVGSRLDPGDVLDGVSDEFIDMFEDEYKSLSLHGCAAEVLDDRLDAEHAYPYARLVEPLLTTVAEPVGMIHMADTYYLPNDSFGRWNPVLHDLGLARLASLWGVGNCGFPWSRDATPRRDWPCITELPAPQLPALSAELAGDWRPRLAGLPDSVLAEDSSAVAPSRTELEAGLDDLSDWIVRAMDLRTSPRRCVARTGNSLILVTDGGQ